MSKLHVVQLLTKLERTDPAGALFLLRLEEGSRMLICAASGTSVSTFACTLVFPIFGTRTVGRRCPYTHLQN